MSEGLSRMLQTYYEVAGEGAPAPMDGAGDVDIPFALQVIAAKAGEAVVTESAEAVFKEMLKYLDWNFGTGLQIARTALKLATPTKSLWSLITGYIYLYYPGYSDTLDNCRALVELNTPESLQDARTFLLEVIEWFEDDS